MHEEVVGLWGPTEWNRLLVSRQLHKSNRTEYQGSVLTYIESYPQALVELLDWPKTDHKAHVAADLFVGAHEQLVHEADGQLVRSSLLMVNRKHWSRLDDVAPPFFGLLWLSCMVAWGYPDEGEGNFASRFRKLYGLKTGGVQPVSGSFDLNISRNSLGVNAAKLEIRHLWECLSDWLNGHDEYLDFHVPEPAGHEKHVGISYALCQPDLRDRLWLARAVDQIDIAGYDPPPGPALRGLIDQARVRSVSDDFLGHLVRLEADHRYGSGVHLDPVWEAIRKECVDPIATTKRTLSLYGLTVEITDDLHGWDGHLVWRSDEAPISPPPGTTWTEDLFSDRLLLTVTDDGASTGSFWDFLAHPWERPQTGLARIVREGLLCFAHDHRAQLVVVTGSEVASTQVALVRQDILAPFCEVFGGQTQEVPTEGWKLVYGPEVRALSESELPGPLKGLRQLLKTSLPPTARWVGGVAVGKGAFYPSARLLPAVLAPGAASVRDQKGEELLRDEDTGYWRFRAMEQLPTELIAVVSWPSDEGWPDRVLSAPFRDETVRPPREFQSEDHTVVGPEAEHDFAGINLGLTGGHERALPRLSSTHPTVRHYGGGVGQVCVHPRESLLTVYGRRGNPQLSILESDDVGPESKVDGAWSSRRLWREDIKSLGAGNHALRRGEDTTGTTVDRSDPTVAELRRRLSASPSATVAHGADDGHLVRQLEIAYSPLSQHVDLAEHLLAIAAITLGRKTVDRRDFLDWVRQLTSQRDRVTQQKLFALLRTFVESGRIELARNKAQPAMQLIGVRPRLRWGLIERIPEPKKGVFDGALVGVIEHSLSERIKDALTAVADTRWLASTATSGGTDPLNKWICPVVKVMTDDPAAAQVIASRELGERLGPRAALPPIPKVLKLNPSRDNLQPLGGYHVTDTYSISQDGAGHISSSTNDGVVIRRMAATRRNPHYVIALDGTPVYSSTSRDWVAVRASELAGVAAFSRCRHGIVRSRWGLFPRLPLSVARGLLTYGLGLSAVHIRDDERIDHVEYPFGRGASALDELPSAWFDMTKDCACTTR